MHIFSFGETLYDLSMKLIPLLHFEWYLNTSKDMNQLCLLASIHIFWTINLKHGDPTWTVSKWCEYIDFFNALGMHYN
jgi:hypothetical protein